ncbi:hypothetical protein YTPLAS18_11680 [Nitrospira sp.]|nr:hypothetical protein YTPLAS18_11680 [Nitrospira sp.]
MYIISYNTFLEGAMTKTLPISEARANLPDLVDQSSKRMVRFIITRQGLPAAVLMSHAELESWQETLDVAASSEELTGIREGLDQLRRGKSVNFEEVFGEPVRGQKAKRR